MKLTKCTERRVSEKASPQSEASRCRSVRMCMAVGVLSAGVALADVHSVYAAPVASYSFHGACAKALRHSGGNFVQKRSIADFSACRVTATVRDSVTRKKLAGQAIQLFKLSANGQTKAESCFDLSTGASITGRKGTARVSFPWDNAACGFALKNVTSGIAGAADARIDVSSQHACGVAAAAVSPAEVCGANDYTGYYTFSTADPGFSNGCGGSRIVGVAVTRGGGSYKAVLDNGLELVIGAVSNSALSASYHDPLGRFTRDFTLVIHPSAAPTSAAIEYRAEYHNNLNDPLSAPSCTDSYTGIAQRSGAVPPDYSGVYRFSPKGAGSVETCGFSSDVDITVTRLTNLSYTVSFGSIASLELRSISDQALGAALVETSGRFGRSAQLRLAPPAGAAAAMEFEYTFSNFLNDPNSSPSCSLKFNGVAAKVK